MTYKKIRFCFIYLAIALLQWGCSSTPNRPRALNPKLFSKRIAWVKDGRQFGIYSLEILDSLHVEKTDSNMFRVQYALESRGFFNSTSTNEQIFIEKMIESSIRSVCFMDGCIEVATTIVDSTYSTLKKHNPKFFHRENRMFEDREPPCDLAYSFLIFDKATQAIRNEALYQRSVFYSIPIEIDSVFYYRTCL